MNIFGEFQSLLIVGLAIASLALKGFAFIDALRVPTNAYPAAGKGKKPLWAGILGVALVVDIATFPHPLFFVNLLGIVAAGVYLVDVRPAVRAVRGR